MSGQASQTIPPLQGHVLVLGPVTVEFTAVVMVAVSSGVTVVGLILVEVSLVVVVPAAGCRSVDDGVDGSGTVGVDSDVVVVALATVIVLGKQT